MTIEESLSSIASSLAVLVALQSHEVPTAEPEQAKKAPRTKKAAEVQTAEVIEEPSSPAPTITVADVRAVAAQLLDKGDLGKTKFTATMKKLGIAKLSEAPDSKLPDLFALLSANLEGCE